jgi:UbiA prenyltransferase family
MQSLGSFPLQGGFIVSLLGIIAVAAGSSALNQVFERKSDCLMKRTALRPVAQNRLSPAHGAIVGLILILGGSLLLLMGSNLLSVKADSAIDWAVELARGLCSKPDQKIPVLNAIHSSECKFCAHCISEHN